MTKNSDNGALLPRKQAKQQRSKATVDTILEAAARILEDKGFDGLTTNAIAERAGVSIGSCYQYFPSKEAIVATLIERESAELGDALQQAGKAGHWTQGIGLAVAAAVRHQMQRPRLAVLLDSAEYALNLPAEQAGGVNALAQAVLVRLLQLGDAPAVTDIAQSAADLVAMAHGMIESAGRRGESDHQSINERVLRAIGGYLAADGKDNA